MEQYFDTAFDTAIITEGDTSEITFEIFVALRRNAKGLQIINDGTVKMYVKIYSGYHNMEKNMEKWQAVKRGDIDPQNYHPIPVWPTAECWIYPGQRRSFRDVYKVLVGKTSIGNQYRITEFDITYVDIYDEKIQKYIKNWIYIGLASVFFLTITLIQIYLNMGSVLLLKILVFAQITILGVAVMYSIKWRECLKRMRERQ